MASPEDTSTRGGVAGGIMLVGIGLLIITNWWWPGIMLVIGCAAAGERFLRGEVAQAIGVFALFLAIPLGIAIVQHIDIPWNLVIPFVLIVIGVVIVVRAVTSR